MADRTTRRPLPALIALLALTMLTALVWWRVLNRTGTSASTHNPCATHSSIVVVLPQPTSVALTVYNSTQRSGLAKTTSKVLAKDGFKVLGYGNDPGALPVPGVAEIRFTPDQSAGATLLSYYVPGAKLVQLDPSSDSKIVLSLGLKFASLATPASAQAALSSAHASQAPPGTTPTPTPTPTSTC
jgi:hypothetical protein